MNEALHHDISQILISHRVPARLARRVADLAAAMAAEYQPRVTHDGPLAEQLLARLEMRAPDAAWRWITVTDLARELGLPTSRGEVNRLGRCLTARLGIGSRRSNGVLLRLVPPLRAAETNAAPTGAPVEGEPRELF